METPHSPASPGGGQFDANLTGLMATALLETPIQDRSLLPIRDKVLNGRRLSFEDGVALYRSHDLLAIGQLANHVREKRHGDAAYFVWNTHVNHTNVCVATCDFCAFAAKPGEARGYTMKLQEIFDSVEKLPKPVREVHIVGGLHPDLPWSYFVEMMEGIKRIRPEIHIKAFTAVEVYFFHKLYRKPVADVLAELKAAGLDSMPGGGAEIFAKATRDKLIKGKADAQQWLDVMREAHRQGIPTNATMLYGHVESVEDRVDHLVRLRELQDETGGFVTYIPLAFQPWEAPLMGLPETTGFEDLKAIAVGRLMLDNFPHVKSYWIMIGPRLAQVGLSFGADDIDGTVTEEKIAHDAGARTPQTLTVHDLVRLVREAGRRPVERDTVFNVVKEW
jgi:aminodeoxyfutalosine synthase